MRLRRSACALAALFSTAVTLAGCQGSEAAPSAGPAASQGPAVAPEAAKVGAAASGCELPVSFGIAESWKPKTVSAEAVELFGELARRGPVAMACDIDAKPAGKIGFLRVWTGGQSELRAGLTDFIGDKAEKPVFTEVRIGDRAGLEVSYMKEGAPDEPAKAERAFIVATGKGVAVVSLDSLDSDEHAEMLPAYELAKTTLTVTG